MKKVSRVIIGGTLIALGCGCFLYPNFREWNTQREVESVIHKFDETYSKGIDSDITSEPVKTSDKSDSDKNDTADVTGQPAKIIQRQILLNQRVMNLQVKEMTKPKRNSKPQAIQTALKIPLKIQKPLSLKTQIRILTHQMMKKVLPVHIKLYMVKWKSITKI